MNVARICGLGGEFRLKLEPTFFKAKKKFRVQQFLSKIELFV